MDRARIEEEWLSCESDSPILFAEHIAKLARAEALEDAALICDKYGADVDNEWNRGLGLAKDLTEVADDLAEQIRALKEQK